MNTVREDNFLHQCRDKHVHKGWPSAQTFCKQFTTNKTVPITYAIVQNCKLKTTYDIIVGNLPIHAHTNTILYTKGYMQYCTLYVQYIL